MQPSNVVFDPFVRVFYCVAFPLLALSLGVWLKIGVVDVLWLWVLSFSHFVFSAPERYFFL